jgi:hypothetical protein
MRDRSGERTEREQLTLIDRLPTGHDPRLRINQTPPTKNFLSPERQVPMLAIAAASTTPIGIERAPPSFP